MAKKRSFWIICGSILIILFLFLASTIQVPDDILSKNLDGKTQARCTRTERYKNPAEFDRALSLINQRASEYYKKNNITDYPVISTCIVVKYADTKTLGQDTEGYFIFGDKDTNANYLPIYVDYSYKETDDLITAMLLAHEMTHASQYIDNLNGKDNLSCMDKEVAAFLHQANFIAQLNQEERNSLWSRVLLSKDPNPQLQLVKTFKKIELDAIPTCGNNSQCINNKYIQEIKAQVYNDPGYQKECADQQATLNQSN